MDGEIAFITGKYLSGFISVIAGLSLWVAILVVVDDSGLWHLDESGWLSDFFRLGIVVITAVLATGGALGLNKILVLVLKNITKQAND